MSGTSFPTSPVEKQLFYRTDLHKLYIYNGTGWVDTTLGTDFTAHASRHQYGGADVISLAGLSGEPAELTTHKGLTTGIHGVGSGEIVGTTIGQTLTTKTLDSPIISGAGAATAGELGYDATNHALLIGDGTTNNPLYIGHWKAYTPTRSNITLGNGTLTGEYCQVGKLIIARIHFKMGSTSAMGTAPSFGLPVTATATYNGFSFTANLCDWGTTTYVGWAILISTTSVCPMAIITSGSYANYTNITSTVPHTWAVDDEIHLGVVYEAA